MDVDRLARTIRYVDRSNDLSPTILGSLLANCILNEGFTVDREAVIAFVQLENPDKRLGAGALAELIVAEFGLDEEG